MPFKRIEYSPHAVARMRLRGVGRSGVKRVLARGRCRLEDSLPGRDVRFSKRAELDGRELEVVYTESRDVIVVITVAWRD